MMRVRSLLAVAWALWIAAAAGAAPPMLEKIDLFEGGQAGYALYRIPGIVATTKGTLLAWCEARRTGKSDWDTIDIMLRRSTDGGRTWEPRRKMADVPGPKQKNPVALAKKLANTDDVTYNNPVAIACRDGSVHFLFCLEYCRSFVMHSRDDGLTWTPPVEITAAFETLRKQYDWKVLATGPGHGLELTFGPCQGRLIVPVWLSLGTGGHAHRPSVVATIYSDDQGRSWQAGAIAVPDVPPYRWPNETAAVQLTSGHVLLNVRSESDAQRRLQTNSPDGASGWTKAVFNDDLWEPICMASLLRYSRRPDADRNRLLFANPHNLDRADGKAQPGGSRDRRNLSIMLSYDEGHTWPIHKSLEPGYSAYSDLAMLPDGTTFCFYERGREADAANKRPTSYAYLTLARFNLEWLTDGRDVPRLVNHSDYDARRDDFEVAGCPAFVIHPTRPAADGARPWVWYAPTIGHHPSEVNGWLLKRLLDRGFYVAGIYVGESFANPESRRQFAAFYQHVTKTYGLAPKVCLLAQSRGGLNHYNLAADHPQWVQCIAGIFPVGDLRSYPGLQRAAPMYHLAPEGLESQLAQHNPIERLAPIAGAKIPILHIHGDADKVVPLEKNSQVILDRYRALGGSMELIVVPGKGHENAPGFFESQPMLDFLLRHGLGVAAEKSS